MLLKRDSRNPTSSLPFFIFFLFSFYFLAMSRILYHILHDNTWLHYSPQSINVTSMGNMCACSHTLQNMCGDHRTTWGNNFSLSTVCVPKKEFRPLSIQKSAFTHGTISATPIVVIFFVYWILIYLPLGYFYISELIFSQRSINVTL